MEISSGDFRVPEGGRVKLDKWPTKVAPVYRSREHYQQLRGEHVARLSSLQQLVYAFNRYAVLLIFQASGAAGKDGAIKHVMSGVDPQGCQVFSFKHPSPIELQHDLLSLPHHARSARARANRHLQPVLLRGGVDCPRPSRDSS